MSLYSTTQVHGQDSSLKIGATEIWISEWSGEHKAENKDGTTTQNNGFKSWVKGIQSLSGSFKCPWDTTQNPYLLGFQPGQTVTLELHITDSSFYALTAILGNAGVNVNSQDIVTYTVAFESQGSFSTPA